MKPDTPTVLDENGSIVIPARMIPSFRTSLAVQRGTEKNLLFKTWGGLGDQICAEPTLRFALKTFKDCRVSLASEHPELFAHLPFKEVYDLKKVQPIWQNYFVFDTIQPPTHLTWEFMSHMITNCVDYPSLCALRCQLPVADREVQISPPELPEYYFSNFSERKWAVVHAGRHWQSKTFPKRWWDNVLNKLLAFDIIPVLIGGDTDDNRGTVDVNPDHCLDLRNKLSVMESIALLQKAQILITNDSAPLHMAATGNAWIGFIATCKHPDYITHWRKGTWGWRMENLSLGGIWDVLDYCPNRENTVQVDKVDPELLLSWLPKPKDVAEWARTRV